MLNIKIPEAKDVLAGELAERGQWIVANVETASSWPVKAQKVTYRGRTIWIMPIMKDRYPAVAMKQPPGLSREACEKLILRFLSALAWVEGAGYLVDGVGGGSMPNPMGRSKDGGFVICDEFDLSYIPEPASEKALLALALMREGRGLNHPGYSFLAFYRVVELAIGSGAKEQIAWINDQISRGLHHRAKEALDKLREPDIGEHLYGSGRCAMAHAKREPIIDPDDPADARRLWAELPIMLELAERATEEKLGVETSQTVWRKHLYELDGFKKILGAEIVDKLVRGEQIAGQRDVNIPDISVELNRKMPYAPLSALTIQAIGQDGQHGHIVHMHFISKDGLIDFRIHLDFTNERLNFEWSRDFARRDDGSPESAEAIAECSRFLKEYWGNGQLRIINAATRELISRKDAYVPVNVWLNVDACDAEIAGWKRLALDRRERSAKFGSALVQYAQGYDVTINGDKS